MYTYSTVLYKPFFLEIYELKTTNNNINKIYLFLINWVYI